MNAYEKNMMVRITRAFVEAILDGKRAKIIMGIHARRAAAAAPKEISFLPPLFSIM